MTNAPNSHAHHTRSHHPIKHGDPERTEKARRVMSVYKKLFSVPLRELSDSVFKNMTIPPRHRWAHSTQHKSNALWS
jgi:hypothetical protein